MPMVWTPMACPFAHFSLNGTVLRQHPQRCLWGTLTIKLYIEMCVKIKTLPKQNCFKVMHLSLSIMDNEGSMLKEDFTSPNIDHICCVPGHARTTGNTLRTWGKFLRSLTHFASIFVKFWRTLKSPRRWGCSSFFNFPCRHGKRLHVWYFFTFFFFWYLLFQAFYWGATLPFCCCLRCLFGKRWWWRRYWCMWCWLGWRRGKLFLVRGEILEWEMSRVRLGKLFQ